MLENTSGEMSQAICAFFYKWNPEKAKENAAVLENWEEITDGGNLLFCMDKKYAQDDKEIEQIWNGDRTQSETDISGICLVTGEKTEISCGDTSDALLYEMEDMEHAVLTCDTSGLHLNYTKDVMDIMTYLRKEWNMKYPDENWD